MKRSIRRQIERAKRQIECRLAEAVCINTGGAVMCGRPVYEVSERIRANPWGGIGLIHRMVTKWGLAKRVDDALSLLKLHVPYHESDHVLNIAYNILCGGKTLDDIEHRRQCQSYLDTLGAKSIPDPTTAGDFCRRFDENAIWSLMEAINQTRVEVWKHRGNALLSQTARIDADGSLVPTTGQCKEGMDIAYEGTWGYHPLLVSLATTGEPLFIVNRSGNRPSHERAAPVFDLAIALCREAGFTDILLRGDTDFALTAAFDAWSASKVRFVFGIDASPKLIGIAQEQDDSAYQDLIRRAKDVFDGKPRARPGKVKQQVVRERGFNVLVTKAEELAEFRYRPGKCMQDYRVVALRKTISNERGQDVLFEEYRYFFYITNDFTLTADQVVDEARQRCNQENIIRHLKGDVRAFHAPVNTLVANWAYMVMASLAWTLKAWAALLLPSSPRRRDKHDHERELLLRMGLRGFVEHFVKVPCQVVRTARRIVLRVLEWNLWQQTFFRLLDAM